MDFLGDELDQILNIFSIESDEIITRLNNYFVELESSPSNKDIIVLIFREAHSLKGSARMIGFNTVQSLAHKMEDIFGLAKEDKILISSDIINLLCSTLDLISDIISESIKVKKEVESSKALILLERLENVKQFQSENKVTSQSLVIDSDLSKSIKKRITDLLKLTNTIIPDEKDDRIKDAYNASCKLLELAELSNVYEIKNHIENVKVKLEFVKNISLELTSGEIDELKTELKQAKAYFRENIEIYKNKVDELKDSIDKESINFLASLDSDSESAQKIIDTSILLLETLAEKKSIPDEQIKKVLKDGLDYINSVNIGESPQQDYELIIQQLTIYKQLAEINNSKKTLPIQAYTKKYTPSEIKTLHVDSYKLDSLVNQVGELIIAKIKSDKNLEDLDALRKSHEEWQKELGKAIKYLKYYERKYFNNVEKDSPESIFAKQVLSLFATNNQLLTKSINEMNFVYRQCKEDAMDRKMIIDEIETMVKNIRVLPFHTIFNTFSRMVRDIAQEMGKKIDFKINGSETSVDKKILEEIKTPLIHILRNSIDHGIEFPQERLMLGKNIEGKIILNTKSEDNKVIIEIIDDGRGFNIDKIKEKAVSKGFLTEEEINSMSEEEIVNIIFLPGFSTGDDVTNISGRGIGLDIVKTKIAQLNGVINVTSVFGKGCCVHIEIPIKMATLGAFLVEVSNQKFAIPMDFIKSFIWKKSKEIDIHNGIKSIIYEDKQIFLYHLSDVLQLEASPAKDKETILILDVNNKVIGLIVDKLLGNEEILHKRLAPPLSKLNNISGVTNLVSGELCLILNVTDIMKNVISLGEHKVLEIKTFDILEFKKILVVDDSVTSRTLEENILKNAKFNVKTAVNPIDAFEKLADKHFDLIITDIEMPEMDGFTFLEKLKTNEKYSDIPVILVSSLLNMENINKAIDCGAEACVAKGDFKQKEFLDMIRTILLKYH